MTPAAATPLAGGQRALIHFVKMEALGNDLILVPAEGTASRDWAQVARLMCARRWGVGGDGLLVLAPGEQARWRMRMLNPDGSEDMCGNGLRCIGVYLQRRGLLGPEGAQLDTIAGRRRIRPAGAGIIEAEMGEPGLHPADLPMAVAIERAIDYPVEVDGERWLVTGVSMGTPHAVLFTQRPVAEEVFLRVSPRLEVHPLFPERTTVTWCSVAAREALRARRLSTK